MYTKSCSALLVAAARLAACAPTPPAAGANDDAMRDPLVGAWRGKVQFASGPFADVPDGFGFPALTSQGIALQGYPIESTLGTLRTPTALAGTFPATSHTYLVDSLGATAASWARNNVIVLPKSTLIVVIE